MVNALRDDLPFGLVYIRDKNIAYFNDFFKKLIDNENFVNEPFEELIHPDYLDLYHQALAAKEAGFDIPVQLKLSKAWVRLKYKFNPEYPDNLDLYMVEDVTDAQIKEIIFNRLAKSFVHKTDGSIFESLVTTLTDVLGAKCAFVGTFCKNSEIIQIRALSIQNQISDPYSYRIEHTPCEVVLKTGSLVVTERAYECFPEDVHLSKWNIESYLGVALYDSSQDRVIGHLVLMDTKVITNDQMILSVLQMYSSRLAVELEKEMKEKQLKNSELKYKNLFDHAFEAKLIYDPKTNSYLEVNKTACELFGYERNEILGMTPFDLKPISHDTISTNVQRYVEAGRHSKTVIEETLNQKKDGTVFETEIAISMLDLENELLLVSLRDISQRKKAEKDLARSESRYRNLFEHAFEAQIVFDPDQNSVLDVNKAACNLFGYNKEEFQQLEPENLVVPGAGTKEIQDVIKKARKAISRGDDNYYVGETLRVKKDGTVFEAEVALSRLDDTQGNLLVSIKDISQQKRTEQQLDDYRNHLEELVNQRTLEVANLNLELSGTNKDLKKSNTELNEALQDLKKTQDQLVQVEKMAALGVFTAGIAHEMNNSLNLITGGTGQMTQEIDEINEISPDQKEKIDDAISLIGSGTQRATNIVKGLASYSQQSSHRKTKCTIDDILWSVMGTTEIRLLSTPSPNIDLIPTLNASVELLAFEGMLHKAFANILDNALYFTEHRNENNLPRQIEIYSSWEVDQNEIIVRIKNYGDLIKKDIINKIFDPLFSTKETGDGAGLGLSVAYSFIQQHKGSIRAINHKNAVTFEVTLPINV